MVLIILREGVKVLSTAFFKTIKETFKQNYMTVEEARKILNIDKDASQETIFKKYEKLYNRNSKENKGSEYLQMIISNAFKILKEDPKTNKDKNYPYE